MSEAPVLAAPHMLGWQSPGWQSRPGRAAVVAPDLDFLRGPTSGVVELPHRLFWQADRRVDLDNPALLAWLYETVLQEAASVDELHEWLDRDKLAELWAEIFLPRGVRAAWEHQHPWLRGLVPLAAAEQLQSHAVAA